MLNPEVWKEPANKIKDGNTTIILFQPEMVLMFTLQLNTKKGGIGVGDQLHTLTADCGLMMYFKPCLFVLKLVLFKFYSLEV